MGCDPNKYDLLYMTDGAHTLRYSKGRRRHETYGQRSQEIILRERNKQGIVAIENTLSNYNAKTTELSAYLSYLTQKHIVDNQVTDFYENMLFRKMAWRRHIQSEWSDKKLVDQIRSTFGACKIGFGNWTGSNKHLKRLLCKNFPLETIDERNTSAKCHNCLGDTETFLKAPKPRACRRCKLLGKKLCQTDCRWSQVKVHGLLRCKNGCGTLWNRDLNAALNIRRCLEWQESEMALREAFRNCGKKRRPMNAFSNLTVTELVELGLGCLDDSDLTI